MTRELMDDAQAVAEVCALGSQIEKGWMDAEKTSRAETSEEAEAGLREWGATKDGGHDPEFQRAWAVEVSRMPPIRDPESPVCPKRVLPSPGDGLPEK